MHVSKIKNSVCLSLDYIFTKDFKRNIFLKFAKYTLIFWFLIALRNYKSFNIEVIDDGAGYYYL